MSRAVERPQSFPLILFFCWLSCRRGKWLSVRSVTSPCASLSVPAEESKGWSATIFYLLHSLIGKPKLILQIKNKPLTFFRLHFQSRPRGSNLNQIAKRCNEGGMLPSEAEVRKHGEELNKVWQSLRRYLQRRA